MKSGEQPEVSCSSGTEAQWRAKQPQAGRRVLLVEDNDLLRMLFSVILGDAGYDVLSVADGRSALSEMDCAAEAIEAVVTDIDLGSAPNGWVVALSARELWPTCRVLYLTGVGTDARSLQGVANGIFLSKPFDVARVADVLTALFAT